eukprot:8577158-Pyramimonas_sp.AAC.1
MLVMTSAPHQHHKKVHGGCATRGLGVRGLGPVASPRVSLAFTTPSLNSQYWEGGWEGASHLEVEGAERVRVHHVHLRDKRAHAHTHTVSELQA